MIADELWAVSSYFNPMRYARRRANFRTFRDRLAAPLVVVELAYGDEFELKDHDADIVLRLRGDSILWQKERLLNLGMKALPSHCRKVAWVDCDIVFGISDWTEAAKAQLDKFAIIQMFDRVHYLAAHATPDPDRNQNDIEFTRPSFGSCIQSNASAAACIAGAFDRRDGTCALGFAWAARREVLDHHGLYDANILGGGDTALVAAATNCFDTVMTYQYMNARQQERYLAWAKPFYDTVQGDVGFLQGEIYHLWHGKIENRRARVRHQGLQAFQFDPFTDIAMDANGCWRWNTKKPEMHEYIREYFAARQEDG